MERRNSGSGDLGSFSLFSLGTPENQQRQRSFRRICPQSLQSRLDDFLCWAVNQAVVYLTQNSRHLVALFLGRAFQGSTAADFSSSSSEEKGDIKPCLSLQLGWILTVGRPKFAAFKGPPDLIFWHCFLMDSSSYFTRLSEILYKGIQNFIGFGKHSVGDDRKRLVVWRRAKKAIYGGSNGLHGCVFVIPPVFLSCGGVETFKAFI